MPESAGLAFAGESPDKTNAATAAAWGSGCHSKEQSFSAPLFWFPFCLHPFPDVYSSFPCSADLIFCHFGESNWLTL